MRVAVITKIFPSSLEPLSAPFNLQQIAALAARCDLEVLEAIPHLPIAGPIARRLAVKTRAARLADLPDRERVHGIDVTYVRQLYVPRVGLPVAVPLYVASLLPYKERLRDADVVLATWAYPDGCAAVLAARSLGKPCVVKVHGSDVNVVLQTRAARAIAARVLPLADAVVAVSRPLADELAKIGVPREKIRLVRNGVDGNVFRPRDRAASRRELLVPEGARVVLFVGRLEPQKGIHDLLDAFAIVHKSVPRARLVLVGDGVSGAEVRARAAAWPAQPGADAAPIQVLGVRRQPEIAAWLGACDVMTLPSWAEGTPNVVLEALASGRPAVATSVGGIPDVLADPRSGIVVPPRDPRALAGALVEALGRTWDPGAVAACGPGSWRESADALFDVLAEARAPYDAGDASRSTSATSAAGSIPLFATTFFNTVSRSIPPIPSLPRSRSRSR